MPSSVPPPETSSERRRMPRAPIELQVEYKRLNSFFAYYTRNISKGGTFIATPRPLPIGTEFLFHLKVPGLPQPLELPGKVVWIVSSSEATAERPAGMGIQFLGEASEQRREIDEIVEALMIDAFGEELYRRLVAECTSPPAR